MRIQQTERRMRVISFSGIDGAGKSTQIESLCEHLSHRGVSFRLVSFWDQVASFSWLRESAGHTLFGGDRGVGTASAPVNRKDKNVRSWFMTCTRLFFYFADTIVLRKFISKAQASGHEVLIFDRYIYDELANLPLQNPVVRGYVRAIARFAPRTDVRFLLDADPALARARKPEYPVEFLQQNRRSYFVLSDLIGGFTVIGPAPIRDVEQKVQDLVATWEFAAPAADKETRKTHSLDRRAESANPDRSHPEGATL
jgi:thymidylate kinase